MADDVKHGREFGSIEQQALEHVWIHSARWLDLAERDGLRVMVRGEGCRLFDARGRSYLDGLAGSMSSMSVMAVPKSRKPWRSRRGS
jgi:hypothetical protein